MHLLSTEARLKIHSKRTLLPVSACFAPLLYLFDGIQHALASLPWLGVLPDTAQTGHAVPFPVFQLSVESICQQQHGVVDVAVGDLKRKNDKERNIYLTVPIYFC